MKNKNKNLENLILREIKDLIVEKEALKKNGTCGKGQVYDPYTEECLDVATDGDGEAGAAGSDGAGEGGSAGAAAAGSAGAAVAGSAGTPGATAAATANKSTPSAVKADTKPAPSKSGGNWEEFNRLYQKNLGKHFQFDPLEGLGKDTWKTFFSDLDETYAQGSDCYRDNPFSTVFGLIYGGQRGFLYRGSLLGAAAKLPVGMASPFTEVGSFIYKRTPKPGLVKASGAAGKFLFAAGLTAAAAEYGSQLLPKDEEEKKKKLKSFHDMSKKTIETSLGSMEDGERILQLQDAIDEILNDAENSEMLQKDTSAIEKSNPLDIVGMLREILEYGLRSGENEVKEKSRDLIKKLDNLSDQQLAVLNNKADVVIQATQDMVHENWTGVFDAIEKRVLPYLPTQKDYSDLKKDAKNTVTGKFDKVSSGVASSAKCYMLSALGALVVGRMAQVGFGAQFERYLLNRKGIFEDYREQYMQHASNVERGILQKVRKNLGKLSAGFTGPIANMKIAKAASPNIAVSQKDFRGLDRLIRLNVYLQLPKVQLSTGGEVALVEVKYQGSSVDFIRIVNKPRLDGSPTASIQFGATKAAAEAAGNLQILINREAFFSLPAPVQRIIRKDFNIPRDFLPSKPVQGGSAGSVPVLIGKEELKGIIKSYDDWLESHWKESYKRSAPLGKRSGKGFDDLRKLTFLIRNNATLSTQAVGQQTYYSGTLKNIQKLVYRQSANPERRGMSQLIKRFDELVATLEKDQKMPFLEGRLGKQFYKDTVDFLKKNRDAEKTTAAAGGSEIRSLQGKFIEQYPQYDSLLNSSGKRVIAERVFKNLEDLREVEDMLVGASAQMQQTLHAEQQMAKMLGGPKMTLDDFFTKPQNSQLATDYRQAMEDLRKIQIKFENSRVFEVGLAIKVATGNAARKGWGFVSAAARSARYINLPNGYISRLADVLPNKTTQEVLEHYDDLVDRKILSFLQNQDAADDLSKMFVTLGTRPNGRFHPGGISFSGGEIAREFAALTGAKELLVVPRQIRRSELRRWIRDKVPKAMNDNPRNPASGTWTLPTPGEIRDVIKTLYHEKGVRARLEKHLNSRSQIPESNQLSNGVEIMKKTDLEKLVLEMLNENTGMGYAKYPYHADEYSEDEPDEDYMTEWKSLVDEVCGQKKKNVDGDPKTMEDAAVEVAKLFVKDLELFREVLELSGSNKSVGVEIMKQLKAAKEKYNLNNELKS